MQSGAELGQSFYLAVLEHFRVAALQVIEHDLLPGHFARGHIIDVFRSQLRRRIELIERLVEALFFLQAKAFGKSLVSFF